MTNTTAATDHLHSKPAAAGSRPAPSGVSRDLGAAVRAVNDQRRQLELRRMEQAARLSTRAPDWDVPVARSRLDAMEQQLREAAALRKALEHAPVVMVPFSALRPHTLRDMPLALSRLIGHVHDAGVRDRPLTRLFVAADVARLQQALYDGNAATLVAHLRRVDGRALRCSVHLAPVDPADPDWRWACIVRLPHEATQPELPHTAVDPAARHLPPKPNQRARPDAWPLQPSN